MKKLSLIGFIMLLSLFIHGNLMAVSFTIAREATVYSATGEVLGRYASEDDITVYTPTGADGDWFDRFFYCLDFTRLAQTEKLELKMSAISNTTWNFSSSIDSRKVEFPYPLPGGGGVVFFKIDSSAHVAGMGIKGDRGNWSNPGLLIYGKHDRYSKESYVLHYYDKSKDTDMWYLFNINGSRATGVYYEMHRGTGVESDHYDLTGTRK